MKNSKLKETGQSMVELAVSIIVLLILLAGVVDLGRLAFYYITVRDSAQEAASFGSIFSHNNEQIIERAKAGAIASGVDPSRIEVIVEFKSSSGSYICKSSETCASDPDTRDELISSKNNVGVGDVIEVTVTDPSFPITMPLLGTIVGGQVINVSASVQDVVLRVVLTPVPTPTTP